MSKSPDFDIRPAREEDYPALLALSPRLTTGAAPWRDPVRFAAATRRWIESSLASAHEDGHAVMVALLDGRVAGMVSLAEREHFTGDLDAYVGELVTGGAVEGRGAGQALMAAAERWAASRGLSRVSLETGTRNHRARHFYDRAGYEEEEVRLSKAVRPDGPEELSPASARSQGQEEERDE
jgi:ribosomal protein S18 acetylase RimI-like enzyme